MNVTITELESDVLSCMPIHANQKIDFASTTLIVAYTAKLQVLSMYHLLSQSHSKIRSLETNLSDHHRITKRASPADLNPGVVESPLHFHDFTIPTIAILTSTSEVNS
jgi:hypothetical protein